MDNVFQAVDDHPEGVVIGITDNEKDNLRHITHKDKKFHLYNDAINEYIRNITPEKEKTELDGEREYPFVISSGRHSDGGVNGVMRNPDTYVYRKPYALAMNPEDAEECGFKEGQEVRVTTKGGTLVAPVEISYQIARGYFFVPHHFGFTFNGNTVGEGVSKLTRAVDIDTITGNPFLRYIPNYMQECFPAAVDGTMFENTKLEIEVIPGLGKCKSCSQMYQLLPVNGACPQCGKKDFNVISGTEFNIKEIVAC